MAKVKENIDLSDSGILRNYDYHGCSKRIYEWVYDPLEQIDFGTDMSFVFAPSCFPWTPCNYDYRVEQTIRPNDTSVKFSWNCPSYVTPAEWQMTNEYYDTWVIKIHRCPNCGGILFPWYPFGECGTCHRNVLNDISDYRYADEETDLNGVIMSLDDFEDEIRRFNISKPNVIKYQNLKPIYVPENRIFWTF